jgi:hypothetical protein
MFCKTFRLEKQIFQKKKIHVPSHDSSAQVFIVSIRENSRFSSIEVNKCMPAPSAAGEVNYVLAARLPRNSTELSEEGFHCWRRPRGNADERSMYFPRYWMRPSCLVIFAGKTWKSRGNRRLVDVFHAHSIR